VKIHCISPGGTPVEEFGNSAIPDPDAVFYDTTGQFSGTPGAVIVAGQQLNSTVGQIVKILPDGAIVTIYGPTAFSFNPNLFVQDAARTSSSPSSYPSATNSTGCTNRDSSGGPNWPFQVFGTNVAIVIQSPQSHPKARGGAFWSTSRAAPEAGHFTLDENGGIGEFRRR